MRFLVLAVLCAGCVVASTGSAHAATTTKYVDCLAGNDGAGGGSTSNAWKTLNRANKATLNPGDRLLLKRGCVWNRQRLEASWTGTKTAPIRIGAYGSGDMPKIRDGLNQNVQVTGAWQVIDHIAVVGVPTSVDPCGQPLGEHYGFNVQPGAHDNTIQYSSASHELAGVHLAAGALRNHILHNTLAYNNMLKAFSSNPEADHGAWGVLLNGDDNEIAFNTFHDNRAVCTNGDYKLRSKSINIYEAQDNTIHHNVGRDRVFAELGSSDARRTRGTRFSYNVFYTAMTDSRFVTTRGAEDAKWGPVMDTRLTHNSTYQTGPGSIGISCSLGCDGTVLSTESNAIWAEKIGVFADRDYPDSRDLYWNSAGKPTLSEPGISPSIKIANPRYIAPSDGNLRVQTGSPTIDAGYYNGTYTVDAYGTRLPQGASVDIGAAERS